ncbi:MULTISPECIES: LysE family translocator [Achromobacter]|uniref:LysE family translocator n=1 Tax=Alcaligenes xylosoxydans xylosoxydans TaxID=85698 RepID=A0A424WAB5_ALCXX|nr:MULTISPECIES: LysE family translocator [Achromobacter]MBC9905100.1 LysE family translocator [Achromobacter xylosoxidans]MBD0870590.1 LysE family translocator [Achromobacter xylosoxidans]MDH1303311.1 LysE family translocator [Achromobacter sp. GD03932]QNP85654.1 LysE family translocator [Achromobacter xylosoxidans]RPJ90279.1 LysE family translocator [Achromobacter xylosoxidans]
MTELIAVALITILAVISPGPDFAMVTRNSYLFGRRTGLICALGIALGVQVHVFYTMFGVSLLAHYAQPVLQGIKLAGACYLVYMGWKTFFNRTQVSRDLSARPPITGWQALYNGFLTNALNPKTTLFVVSTYTQVVSPGTPLSRQFGYGLFMSLAHWVWFGAVAWSVSSPFLRRMLLDHQLAADRVVGAVLMALGAALAAVQL